MKIGILIGEEREISESLKMTKVAEKLGYDSLWFGEHTGIRDALLSMGMAAMASSKIKLGSCAINAYTRNVGVVAAAVNTLSWIAPDRIMLGIASGEEVLSSFGIRKREPLNEMKEFIVALRLMFEGKQVNYHGSHVNLNDAKIERKLNIPILLAATGPKMLELGSRIADGVILNFLVTSSYMASAHRIVGKKQVYQLIAVSLNRDGSNDDGKKLISKFFFLAPEFFRSIGIAEEVINSVITKIKSWPPNLDDLNDASRLIPDDIVRQLMASGTAEEILSYIIGIVNRWNVYPILYLTSGDIIYALNELGKVLDI
ncbi:MAG: LLM class flavin-dependent oxidoreductase [Conexivisphaerales archaeon]